MTLLPARWVLLALLLATIAAHRVEHACVRLCRARNTSPVNAGVCEHRQRLVLQSGGGRYPIQRLFRLCLTPCHGAAEEPFFDHSHACRFFRESLVRSHGCPCDHIDHDSERLELRPWVNAFHEDPLEMETVEVEEDTSDEAAVPGLNPGSNLSEEDSTDWDRWCRTQCDNGQGGSACNCDIIP